MLNGDRTEAELWFERYLDDHGYDHGYEPPLGVPTRPDFLVCRNGVELVCEVKAFEEMPALERRLSGTNQAVMVSSEDVYGPMRKAAQGSAAAQAAGGIAASPGRRACEPDGLHVHLTLDNLAEAMFGNPGYAGRFNPEEGRVEDLHFEYGRYGRLRVNHPYISAVAILEERALAREAYEAWLADWKQTRPKLENPSYGDLAAEYIAAQEEWEASGEAAKAPEGNAYFIELLTTGSPDAAPVPDNVFDGPRDKRRDVLRVAQRA